MQAAPRGLGMARYLKTGITETAAAEADAQVRAKVEEIIADVKARGDAAVRHWSETFDNWSPETLWLDRFARFEICDDD